MNAVTPSTRAERLPVLDAVPILDTGRFEQMQRIATVMARSPLVPMALRCEEIKEGNEKRWVPLPWEEAFANCFLVTNQAVRWTLDPFAVAQCCSVVHGRLMYEGKLVAAVIAAKLGEQLTFEWNDKAGDQFGIRVTGSDDRRGNPRIIEGTVGDWKTNGSNSPWKPSAYRKMLTYRGTREWTRLYEPAVLLGVYTPDEMEDLQQIAQAERGRPVGPPRQVRQIAAPENKTTGPAAAVVAKPDTKPASTQHEIAADAAQDQEQAAELDAIVEEFVRRSVDADTRSLLEEAEAFVQPYQDDNLLSLAQRTTVANAWEEADARLSKTEQATKSKATEADADAAVATVQTIAAEAAAKDKPQQDPEQFHTEEARKHPAFQRGFEDFKHGLKKCLKPEYRDNMRLLTLWSQGQVAGQQARERGEI